MVQEIHFLEYTMISKLLLAGLFAACAFGQDYRSAEWTAPISTRNTTPGVCRLGQMFIRSDQAAGQNLYVCGSHNDWSLVGGGGGDSLTVPGPSGAVLFSDTGALGGASIHAATAAEVAGVDLVSNGSFTSGLTGWTVSGDGTGWVLDGSGHLHHIPGSNTNYLQATVNVSLKDVYLLKVQVISQTAGSTSLNLGDGCNSDCSTPFTVGAYTYIATSGWDDGPTPIQIVPSADSDITISSIQLIHQLPLLYLPALGNGNVGIGTSALALNDTGDNDLAIGAYALFNNSSGKFNLAIGPSALYHSTEGANNIAVGVNALFSNQDGYSQIAIGNGALSSVVSANDSIAVGSSSLASSLGSGNVTVGNVALFHLVNGNDNIGVGSDACSEVADATDLTCIMSGDSFTGIAMRGTQKNASQSILLGPASTTGTNSNSGSALTNVVAINGTATQSNQTVIGNSSTVETVIGGGLLRMPLHTPASSSENCTAGQFSDGIQSGTYYHFLCVATNTWVRAAYSTF